MTDSCGTSTQYFDSVCKWNDEITVAFFGIITPVTGPIVMEAPNSDKTLE